MKSKKQSFPFNQRLRLSDCYELFMEKNNKKNLHRNSPRPSFNPPSPVIQRTKTLKKHKNFESKMGLLQSHEKISQRNSQSSVPQDVLSELASYMKENNSQMPFKKEFNWEQMLVGESQKTDKTMTAAFKKTQYPDDYFDDVFDDSGSSTKEFQEYKYKKNDALSISRTESMRSSSTEPMDPYSPPKKHGKKSKSSSDDSSELINMAIKRRKQTQQQEQTKHERKAKKSVTYQEDDDVDEIWQFIQQQQELKRKKTKQPRKSSETFNRSPSPSFEVNIFLKKKNSYLNIESPEQVTKESNKNRRTFIVSNQKNKQQGNSCSNIFGNNQRDSEYKPKKLKKEKEEQNTCSICLCDIEQRSKLPCKHCFCHPCLQDWINKTSNCPNCRKNAEYYLYEGVKYEIEQKVYSLENYVDNIGEDSDGERSLDCQCYNCDETLEGDELLVCDRCLVNASHVGCDPSLRGKEPPPDREWFCHVCRASPNMWYREIRHR